jgi:uncharacterized membrane protein
MGVLILGLVLFLGVHSVRIVANDWRTQVLAQRGEGAWKGLYSVLSAVGLGLVIWGYGLARQQPVVLWLPPVATRHIAALLMLVSFILLTAALRAAQRHQGLAAPPDGAGREGLGFRPPAGQRQPG